MRLKELRGTNTVTETAKKLGLQRTTYNNYESGIREPDFDTLVRIANYYDVSVDYLLGRNEKKAPAPVDEEERIKKIGGFDLLSQETHTIPLVGRVVAGKPIESPEYLEGYVHVGYKNPEEYFALRVRGDSMIGAGITENSILIVHKQSCVENGDIVIVAVDGESTVKRFKENKGIVFLMPENPLYEPIIVTPENDFYIFGKVIQIRTDL